MRNYKHVYSHQDVKKDPTETKNKKNRMTIDCKIEKLTTQVSFGTNNESSKSESKASTENLEVDNEDNISNVM